MHEPPPDADPQIPRPNGTPSAPFGADPAVDAIVANAVAAEPPATGRPPERASWRSMRRRGATTATPAPVTVRHVRGSSTSPAVRMLAWGLLALLVLGAGAVATGAVQFGPPGTSPLDRAGGGPDRNGSWSYYHDQDYDTGSTGAKWTTDRTRSSDPDEAVLGDTTRWEYDGPYKYGPYGSDGMRRRASGRETVDPLYSQPAPAPDVFSEYGGDLDPSGGAPVGVAPSSMTNPYYDPYAGYSNPYANRIRLSYGEGAGRGAYVDGTGTP